MRGDVSICFLQCKVLRIAILFRNTYGAARSWAIVTVYGREGR